MSEREEEPKASSIYLIYRTFLFLKKNVKKIPLLTDKNEVFVKDFVSIEKYVAVGFMIVTHHKKLVCRAGYSEFTNSDKMDDVLFLYRGELDYSARGYFTGEQLSLSPRPLSVLCADEKKEARLNEPDRARQFRRIRSKSRSIAYGSRWAWYVTLTVSPSLCDRYSFDDIYRRVFRDIIYRYNHGMRSDRRLLYFFVPEFHKDGAIHLHGLLKNVRRESLRRNEHGYLEIADFRERLGFMNIQSLSKSSREDYKRTVDYVLKYVTKNFEELPPGVHSYYCSKGLPRGEITQKIYDDSVECLINSADYVYENDYVKKAFLSEV